MKLAFCLFKYFPFGGLQRDFIRIARTCQDRGHSIHVYTMSWEGDTPSGFSVSLIRSKGITNHQRCVNFSKGLVQIFEKEEFDLIIGFNKMHNLDIYYAADPCYKAKVMEDKGTIYRLGPRYRSYLRLEKAVFDLPSKVQILLISEKERTKYIQYYGTPDERFHSLPPGISRDRIITENIEAFRKETRNVLDVSDEEFFLLMVGSAFKTKGLDRSLLALASLSESLRKKTRLFVIGKGEVTPFQSMAKRLKISEHLCFLGAREDVPKFMVSADLLLHPAYSENTGTVLIEAMASGLPVLASDVCGYAFHVKNACAGLLIPSPYHQQSFNNLLQEMLLSSEQETWKRKGFEYVLRNDFFSMTEKAADIIESLAKRS